MLDTTSNISQVSNQGLQLHYRSFKNFGLKILLNNISFEHCYCECGEEEKSLLGRIFLRKFDRFIFIGPANTSTYNNVYDTPDALMKVRFAGEYFSVNTLCKDSKRHTIKERTQNTISRRSQSFLQREEDKFFTGKLYCSELRIYRRIMLVL